MALKYSKIKYDSGVSTQSNAETHENDRLLHSSFENACNVEKTNISLLGQGNCKRGRSSCKGADQNSTSPRSFLDIARNGQSVCSKMCGRIETLTKPVQAEAQKISNDVVLSPSKPLKRPRTGSKSYRQPCGKISKDNVSSVLSCPICLEVLFQPYTLVCGHSFCKECILTYCDMHENRKPACPTCRQDIVEISNLKPSIILKNIISQSCPEYVRKRERLEILKARKEAINFKDSREKLQHVKEKQKLLWKELNDLSSLLGAKRIEFDKNLLLCSELYKNALKSCERLERKSDLLESSVGKEMNNIQDIDRAISEAEHDLLV